MVKTKYLIIGAGLSGLTTAFQLLAKGEDNFIILEGRNRIGGRISTSNHIDLGATWFQNHHQYVTALVKAMNLKKYPQFSAGRSVLVYNSIAPAHYFESDPTAPAAFRIAGGSAALITALAQPVLDKIQLNSAVLHISEKEEALLVPTENESYHATRVISTIPPQLAANISFTPPLPEKHKQAMQQTHTWMSNAIKIGLTFKKAFWREKELSGTVIGQIGPTIELYDHNDIKNTNFCLMGFVNEGLRDLSAEKRKEKILAYLETHLGPEVQDYLTYQEKDWSQDPFTSCEQLKSVYISPSYGNPLFQKPIWNGSLYFSGAETSPVNGGYMDGAIYSALSVVDQLLD